VWLDPLGDGGRGAGMLCDLHADRMSPPRGWNLLDRRGAESRLWISRATAGPVIAAPTRRHERGARSRPLAAPGPRLPFDAPEPTRAPWSPHDRPGPDLERVLDARTPLLARAFAAAPPVDDEA